MINRRFKDLVDQFQHFKQVEVVGKARKEYNDGLLRLTQWLREAEELVAREVPCKHAVLKDYLNEIDVSSQINTEPELFKKDWSTIFSFSISLSNFNKNIKMYSYNIFV
jgi:hypothetical protein